MEPGTPNDSANRWTIEENVILKCAPAIIPKNLESLLPNQ